MNRNCKIDRSIHLSELERIPTATGATAP